MTDELVSTEVDPDLAKSDAVAMELQGRPICSSVTSSSTQPCSGWVRRTW